MSSVYGGPADVKLENELSEPEDDLDWGTSKTSDDYRKFRQVQFHMDCNERSRTIQKPDNIDMKILYDLKPDDILVIYFDTRDPGLIADVIRKMMQQLHEKYKCKVIALPHLMTIVQEDKETFKNRLQEIIKYLDEE